MSTSLQFHLEALCFEVNMQIIKGKFIEECPNRFLALVDINEEVMECYVPSSSRLSNYLKLEGKEVLLTENKNKKSRTQYTLYAVKYYGKYILLNLNNINKIVGQKYLNRSDISYEKNIDGYKSDIFLNNDKKIIEIKGLIGIKKEVYFPTVYSERAIIQLEKLKALLLEGYKVEYYLVSLSPIIRKINKNPIFNEYLERFSECISLGMTVNTLAINIDDLNNITFKKIKFN